MKLAMRRSITTVDVLSAAEKPCSSRRSGSATNRNDSTKPALREWTNPHGLMDFGPKVHHFAQFHQVFFGWTASFVHCPSTTALTNMPVGPLMLVTSTFKVYRPGATVTGQAAKLLSWLEGVKH